MDQTSHQKDTDYFNIHMPVKKHVRTYIDGNVINHVYIERLKFTNYYGQDTCTCSYNVNRKLYKTLTSTVVEVKGDFYNSSYACNIYDCLIKNQPCLHTTKNSFITPVNNYASSLTLLPNVN